MDDEVLDVPADPPDDQTFIEPVLARVLRGNAIARDAKTQADGRRRHAEELKPAVVVRPRVLIVDEPTRGIDVGAKVEVHNLLIEMAKTGIAIIVISSELPEVLSLADRILTMREGHVTGEVTRAEASPEKLMTLMTIGSQRAA